MNQSIEKTNGSQKIFYLVLILFVLFSQSVHGFYAIYDLSPPGAFVLLSFIGMFWLIGDWFSRDSKKQLFEW